MLLHPCGANLVDGFFGTTEGHTTRTRRTTAKVGGDDDTAGFILWCPDYANASDDGNGNIFAFKAVSSTTLCANSVAVPLGAATPGAWSSGASVTGTSASIKDPAFPLLDNTMVQDARTVAACLSLVYTGKLTDESGEVCALHGVPLAMLIDGEASVDRLFMFAESSQRIGGKAVEVVSHPSKDIERFRHITDSCVTLGTAAASASTIGAIPAVTEPECFGFAWRGLDATANNPMSFSTTKIVEWRTALNSSIQHTAVVHHARPSAHITAPAKLDKIMPSWKSREAVKKGFDSVLGQMMDSFVANGEAQSVLSHAMASKGVNLARAAVGRISY